MERAATRPTAFADPSGLFESPQLPANFDGTQHPDQIALAKAHMDYWTQHYTGFSLNVLNQINSDAMEWNMTAFQVGTLGVNLQNAVALTYSSSDAVGLAIAQQAARRQARALAAREAEKLFARRAARRGALERINQLKGNIETLKKYKAESIDAGFDGFALRLESQLDQAEAKLADLLSHLPPE